MYYLGSLLLSTFLTSVIVAVGLGAVYIAIEIIKQIQKSIQELYELDEKNDCHRCEKD